MIRRLHHRHRAKSGFTIVELLIIAPIVILTIGAFITVIVNMTGDVLASRTANVLTYSIQDTLNRIEDDVKLSSTFLAQSNIALTSPQGYDNSTAVFNNVDATNGNMLILNTLATTGNPLVANSGLVYLTNLPNACTSSQVNQNTPMTLNVIYFIKNSSLWRRVVMPSTYATAGCSVPWQQPSCAPAVSGAFCKAQDVKLVDNITTNDFVVQYFNTADATIANTVASDTGSTVTVRNSALQSIATVGASITLNTTAGGRPVSQSGSIRATKLDINASTIAPVVTPTTPVAPTVTASLSQPTSVVFTWPTVPGATSYTIDYNINGGAWTNGFTNQTTTTYTPPNTKHTNVVNVRVNATNSAGTSGYGTSSITIPLWTPLAMQNNWADYGNAFATGAYTKTSDGLVVLKGLIKRGGSPVQLENISQLPVGYRPANIMIFTTDTNPNTASRIDVYPDGTVKFVVGSGGWLSLDGIKFLPTGSPYTFTPMTLVNGWVNYNGGFQTAGYTVDGMGRTQIQGLVANGVATNGTQIGVLPAGLIPGLYQHQTALNTDGFGHIGLGAVASPPTGVVAKGGANSFLSLNNMFYPASYGGWTNLTLVNGWVWYDNGGGIYSTPQYTKSADGIVTLKGLIKNGTATAGTVITSLPAGYRPKERLLVQITSISATGRIDIDSSGNVIVDTLNNGWAALDGVNFVAEQ